MTVPQAEVMMYNKYVTQICFHYGGIIVGAIYDNHYQTVWQYGTDDRKEDV